MALVVVDRIEPDEELVSVGTLAKTWDVSTKSVWRMIRRGDLEVIRVGKRCTRIRKASAMRTAREVVATA